MHERTAGQRDGCFRNLACNLQQEGFTVYPAKDGLLSVELENQPLCCVSDNSKARYRDVTSESRYNVMERATDIAGITGEHMSQIDAAPILKIAQFKKGTGNLAKKSCKYQIF